MFVQPLHPVGLIYCKSTCMLLRNLVLFYVTSSCTTLLTKKQKLLFLYHFLNMSFLTSPSDSLFSVSTLCVLAAWVEASGSSLLVVPYHASDQTKSHRVWQSNQPAATIHSESFSFLFVCRKQMKPAGALTYIRGHLVADNVLIWREIDPGRWICNKIS